MVNKGAVLIFGNMAYTRGNFKPNLFGFRASSNEALWGGPKLNSFFSFIGVGVTLEVRLRFAPMWGSFPRGGWVAREPWVGSRSIGWVSDGPR